jgi:hypothetical protein
MLIARMTTLIANLMPRIVRAPRESSALRDEYATSDADERISDLAHRGRQTVSDRAVDECAHLVGRMSCRVAHRLAELAQVTEVEIP